MGKGAYTALQIAGMVITIVFAQAAIRSMIDPSVRQLWGAVDWVPGGWTGRLVALVVVTAAGVVLAGWAHDRATQR